MIRCAYCELFNSLECISKHKDFSNDKRCKDKICEDFSLDPKRLDGVRRYTINKKIQELLIEYQDLDSYPSPYFSPNIFEIIANPSENVESKGKS